MTHDATQATETIQYDDGIARKFIFASVLFGAVGLLVGVFIATQLFLPQLNLASYLSFGRLRPLHTNAVIFAFVGNMMFAGIYYSTQRLLKARMASDLLSQIHFWGWQLVFAVNFFWTFAKRREKHLYVAIWFYIAMIVTVAILHVVNALALPLSALKSYSLYAGVQDALVQWWYGHNAVAFFLTTPILGIMYYFVPKAAERPVYSYRLSIVHFWALVFLYIWAGPHHLLYTALPSWAQTVGMVFSVMLWAPSWGGMINGLLTLRGAYDKVRRDPILKFFVAGITFYGMATFEGPLLSVKSVSALAHYTDWIVGHVHSGALGWNGFMAAGMFYWMVPRLYGKTELYSKSLANAHFWLGTIGILFYMGSMWASGITQGLMLRDVTADGALAHPDFIEAVDAVRVLYVLRALGGAMYLVGFVLMIANLLLTIRGEKAVDGEAVVPATPPPAAAGESTKELLLSRPVLVVTLGLAALIGLGALDIHVSIVAAVILLGVIVFIAATGGINRPSNVWHRLLEGRGFVFTLLTVLAVLIGGIIELVPTAVIQARTGDPKKNPPYTALELEGRDLYVREGCYVCHSQMIRTMHSEAKRYGEPSTMEESAWDHPFQWGSKRTGPDLARVGGKYPNVWHYKHMIDPRSIAATSVMPAYAFLADATYDATALPAKVRAMKTLGVPYTDAQVRDAADAARRDADAIVQDLSTQGVKAKPDSELVALIAYLQRLGKPHPVRAPGGHETAENP